MLQTLLHDADIDIGTWPWRETGCALIRGVHEHRRAQHFIERDDVGHLGLKTDQRVGKDREWLAGCALDALTVPFGRARVLERCKLHDVVGAGHAGISLRDGVLERCKLHHVVGAGHAGISLRASSRPATELTIWVISSGGSGGVQRVAPQPSISSSTTTGST